MPKFTVFCTDLNRTCYSTVWISSVEAEDQQSAALLGRKGCADDWGTREGKVCVLGVAEGDIKILDWGDDGIDLPKPERFSHVLVEVDTFPGATFRGSREFIIERDERGDLVGEVSDLEDLLDDVDVLDDVRGRLIEVVLGTAERMAEAAYEGEEVNRVGLVMCAGRRIDPENDQSPIRETFDVSVWLKPVYEEDDGDD